MKEENLHFQDALQFDWPKFIVDNQLEDKKIWLVSNLPYNISVPLLMGFMKVPQIQYLSLMFQKEVGDKTFWRDGEKNQMGSLLSLSMNYFDTKKLMSVNPACFSPPPKVDSIVVSFTRKADPEISLEEFKEFEIFLRATFQQKRKQLGSVLKTLIHKDKKDQFFEDANVLPTIRAEGLKLKDIYSLYQSFKSL